MLKSLLTLVDSVIQNILKTSSYGESLQQYILSRNPKDTVDIERLTLEWQRGNHKEIWI